LTVFVIKNSGKNRTGSLLTNSSFVAVDLERANQRALVAEKETTALQERLTELQEIVNRQEPGKE
jgi:hypothetical protein